MSIDSISSHSSSRAAQFQQIQQDLSALKTDLQSGNVSQAKTDFATLLDNAPRLKNALSATSSSSSDATSLSALSTALQSGDVSGASTALASLQQNLGSAHHHHHHHHPGGGGQGGPLSPASQGDVQSLSAALQSGNLNAAQQAFAQLQQDDPAFAALGTTSGSATAAATT